MVTIYSFDVLFSCFGTSLLFHVWFYCYFLTCIQISQKVGQVVWCLHLLNNFPQFVVIYTVKGFGIVNKAEGVFLEVSCFSNDPTDVGNFINSKESNCQHLLDCHGEGPGDPPLCSCLQKSHERRSLG